MTKRFFPNLKVERVWQHDYATQAKATSDIADYIIRLYNRQRLHCKLDNLPANAFEHKSISEKPIKLPAIT